MFQTDSGMDWRSVRSSQPPSTSHPAMANPMWPGSSDNSKFPAFSGAMFPGMGMPPPPPAAHFNSAPVSSEMFTKFKQFNSGF